MTILRRLPESQIRAQVQEAIDAGLAIVEGSDDLAVVETAFSTWDKRNEIVLERAFEKGGWLDSTPKDEYASALGLTYPFGPEMADAVTVQGLLADVEVKRERLDRLLATLDAYEGHRHVRKAPVVESRKLQMTCTGCAMGSTVVADLHRPRGLA